jgi:hypothetical protein
MGFFFESDDANDAAINEYRNAQNGLDRYGRTFNSLEGLNGTRVDWQGNELPKNEYGEYETEY